MGLDINNGVDLTQPDMLQAILSWIADGIVLCAALLNGFALVHAVALGYKCYPVEKCSLRYGFHPHATHLVVRDVASGPVVNAVVIRQIFDPGSNRGGYRVKI